MECLHQQTSVCCSISLNPYKAFQTWNHEKKRKRKAILLLAYIADVSCLTNRSFYMRTLSLMEHRTITIAEKYGSLPLKG